MTGAVKKVLIALFCCGITFAFGVYAGLYQAFPVPQLLEAKRGIEQLFSETPPMSVNEDSVGLAKQDARLSGEADIVMLGDSITAGGRWNELFEGVTIHNRGISGDTITGIKMRLDQIIRKRPKKIFLLIGINDIVGGSDARTFQQTYADIVDRLEPHSKIYVQSVLHCLPPKCDAKINDRIAADNRWLKDMARQKGVEFIDLNAALSTDQRLRAEFTEDGVHLNAAGYMQWLRAIEQPVCDGLALPETPDGAMCKAFEGGRG
jgi:lysophospholipase L1-like esterase